MRAGIAVQQHTKLTQPVLFVMLAAPHTVVQSLASSCLLKSSQQQQWLPYEGRCRQVGTCVSLRTPRELKMQYLFDFVFTIR